jgi:hypothetical protein
MLALAVTASAQSPDKVNRQALKAMTNRTGERALREIKSWQAKGTITNQKDGATGNYQAMAAQPNLYMTVFDLHGLETSAGYNGKSGWMRDSRDGLRTMTGQLSRDFQAEAAYRNSRWLDYKKDKSKLIFAGQTTINGKPANTLVLTTPKSVKIKMHFDAVSGLLVREEIPADGVTRVYDYSDFRPVGNGADKVMEPHVINLTIGEAQFAIKLDSVKHNPQIDRAAFEFPKISNEPLPDIAELLKKVSENADELDRLLEKYTYTENITSRELDDKGQLREKETETIELTFYKGNRIRRKVAKDGKPLSAKDEADEQKRIEKRIREIEKHEAEKEKKAAKEQDFDHDDDGDRGQRLTIADVLRASKLVNPRRERFRNRDVIVFDFQPLPGYKPQKDYEKFFGKLAGALWIDATDRQVARIEARLVDSYKIGGGLLASLKEGGSFVLEQDRINNEIWLPTRADINLGVKVLLVKGLNFNQVVTYGNYKRFNVDAEKEKLKDPVPAVKP